MTSQTSAEPAVLAPTRGARVCRFIEEHLVHGEGDRYGEPFRLRRWQRAFLFRLYELDETSGARRYRRALWGLPKGSGKTELAAAIGLYELCGGEHVSPLVVVAAASFEQADLVFGAAKVMARESPTLAELVEVFETEILLRDLPGRMYRVAAVAGTNDGQRPTCFIADELHEWTGKKERVHLVLSNGTVKRAGGLVLSITTAGSNLDTLAGRLYQHGRRVLSGEIDDPAFLFEWWAAAEGADPDEQETWRACNPAAGDFWPFENLRHQHQTLPAYEFARYHLNVWTSSPTQWLPQGAWEALAAPRTLPARTEVVLGFDGSYNNDSTALVGCTKDGYLFVVGCWEKPEHDHGWIVPREEVKATVAKAMQRYKVLELVCDPPGWHQEIEEWGERYGDVLTVAFSTNVRALMSEACAEFYSAVVGGEISHDGDERLARHLSNASVRETSGGAYIVKQHRASPLKIDLAVAAVLARYRATRAKPKPRARLYSW